MLSVASYKRIGIGLGRVGPDAARVAGFPGVYGVPGPEGRRGLEGRPGRLGQHGILGGPGPAGGGGAGKFGLECSNSGLVCPFSLRIRAQWLQWWNAVVTG